MRRLAFLLVALAFLISGCGGDGESDSSTTASTQKQESTPESEAAKKGQNAEEKQAKENSSTKRGQSGARERSARAKAKEIPVGEPVPGSKAVAPGVPTAKGGDNSIQGFGAEGEADPREQALANLIAYTDARLAGEWARACALASPQFREQLHKLIANAKAEGDADKPKGCAETLKLFTPEKAKAAIGEKSRVSEVLSFRVEKPYAYLIVKGAKGKVRFIAMSDEGGEWRVNVLEPEAFTVGDPG